MAENKPYAGEPSFMNELKKNLSQIETEGRRRIRSQKREAAQNRSANLIAEQERIARTIGLLYDAVYSYPDKATPEILMDFVRNHREGPFAEDVTKNFAVALDAYKEKRVAVQKFLRENRDPVLMFEKCFGVKPKGKIETIPGPMTICFRCFDDEDYMAARVHSEVSENDPDSKTQALQRVKNSYGVAFSSVQEVALPQGSVIAERVGKNYEDRPIYRKREVKIEGRNKNTWQRFDYPTSRDSNLVYFQIPVIGEVEAHLSRDEKGNINGIRLFKYSERKELANFEPFNKTERYKIQIPTKQYAVEEWVELEFADDSFAVYDHTRSGAGFETVEYVRTDRLVKDKEASKQIRIHEEQHQFNKLFEPKDRSFFGLPFSEFTRLAHYAAKHPEEDITSLIAMKFAQIYRQAYIDGRARDEIIAYTREGREPVQIANSLARDSLYNYKQQSVTLDSGEKTTWEDFFKRQVAYLTQTLLEKGEATFVLGKSVYAVNFPIKKPWSKEGLATAQAEVEKTLTENYDKKLIRWTGLIKAMQSAGYENRDIVPFLNILPINRWHSAVRRLLKSKAQRPIDKIRPQSK